MRWVVVSLVLLWSPLSSAVAPPLPPVQVSCKNENGVNVDWFVLYKGPFKANVRTGLEYIYIDAGGKRVMSPSSSPSYKSIKDSNGVLAHTLRPMLRSVHDMPLSFGFLSYSDQPPGANANVRHFGHCKGVVLGDSSTNTALWLSHSTPQFPFRRDQNNFWPDSGADLGQTFMCVSLHFSALTNVGEHLKNIRAYPFDYDLPNTFPNALRDAANWVPSDLLQGKFQDLLTRNNKELKIMAKLLNDDVRAGDLYVKLAAGLNSDLNAQTWGCQPRRDESFCDTDMHRVMNVEDITTELGSWSTKQDHSKWAVTTERNIAWTCIGDVNRSGSQYQRWGGAVCIKDAQVNTFFKGYVTKQLQCGKRPLPCDSEISFGR